MTTKITRLSFDDPRPDTEIIPEGATAALIVTWDVLLLGPQTCPVDGRCSRCDACTVSVSGGTVSFNATSTTMTAAQFSERIRIEPTNAAEIGDLVGNGRSGRRYEFAIWTLERDCADDAREPLDEALLSLLSLFDGRETALDELRGAFELRVQCWGSSDSSQGGFWLSPHVLQRLGRLGVDFICTVYLAEDAVVT